MIFLYLIILKSEVFDFKTSLIYVLVWVNMIYFKTRKFRERKFREFKNREMLEMKLSIFLIILKRINCHYPL